MYVTHTVIPIVTSTLTPILTNMVHALRVQLRDIPRKGVLRVHIHTRTQRSQLSRSLVKCMSMFACVRARETRAR